TGISAMRKTVRRFGNVIIRDDKGLPGQRLDVSMFVICRSRELAVSGSPVYNSQITSVLNAAQLYGRQLWRTAVTNWQDDCAQSAGYINLRAASPTKPAQHSSTRTAGATFLRSPGNLAAMRVAAEYEIDVGPRRASKNNRIVRE